jgi:cell division protein FtsW
MDIFQSKIFRGDRVIWIVLLLLSLLSLLIVYSSTAALAYRQASGNTLHFLIRQVFFLGAGIGVMLVMVNFIPVKLYAIFANVLIYLSIGLMMVSIVLKFAGMTDGTGRTLNLGILSFQPAEIAKIALIFIHCQSIGEISENQGRSYKSILSGGGTYCGCLRIDLYNQFFKLSICCLPLFLLCCLLEGFHSDIYLL